MKVVIQCAGSKQSNAPRLRDEVTGEQIVFVANLPPPSDRRQSGVRYCRPDDLAGKGIETWKERLAAYNEQVSNPQHLLRAADLYRPDVYRRLVDAFGENNVFILSAGWGLIRSTFLTPNYDITFSNQGDPSSKRGQRLATAWQDYNQLHGVGISPEEEVHFFGGRNYLALYYALTGHLHAIKIIHHKGEPNRRHGYEYREFRGARNQNWHYSAAQDFIDLHQ